jgi:predicted permease
VLPSGAGFPEDAELWRPLTAAERAADDPEVVVIARLPHELSPVAFESVLGGATAAARATAPAAWQDFGAGAVPLQGAVLGESVPRALLVLLASSALVFVVALTNAAGLQLLRAMEARHDAYVRVALGGSRSRVVRGLLSESLLLAGAGTIFGLLLALLALPALRTLAPGAVPRLPHVELDLRVCSIISAVALLGALAGGLGPALSVARQAGKGLRAQSGVLSGGIRLRSLRSLVALQLGLTTVLVISAGLLTTSLRRMVEVPRGFDPEGLLTVPLAMSSATGSLGLFQQELLGRVGRIPGVAAAAVSNGLPGLGTGMRLEMIGVADLAVAPGQTRPAYLQTVSPSFFATVRLPVLEGRSLPAGRADGAGAAVVNRVFARAFLGPEPWVGRRFTRSGARGDDRQGVEVVGVVADVVTAPGEAPPALLYVSTEAVPIYKNLLVRVDPDVPANATIERIHEEVLALDPEQPMNVTEWMSDALGAYGARTRFHARLMSLFGALALVLAAVGVYGVAAYGASQRQAELGLRRALGARRGGVVALVLGRSLGTSLLGIACGAAGAWGVSHLLHSLLFHVSPFDPVIYLASAAGLGAVAIMAALAPAVRVARDEDGLSRLLREG